MTPDCAACGCIISKERTDRYECNRCNETFCSEDCMLFYHELMTDIEILYGLGIIDAIPQARTSHQPN